jgi:methionine synthase I (cobalamin-dependent)
LNFSKQNQISDDEERTFQDYEHVQEAVWHVEAIKESMPGVPVCASLCIDEQGDVKGVPVGECGVRLARAGADVVGIGGRCGPFRSLQVTKEMVKEVKKAGFNKVCYFCLKIDFLWCL